MGAGPPSRCQNRAYSSCSPPRPFLEALRHWLRSAISDFFSFLLRQCGASLSSLEVANRPPTHVARGRQSRQMVDSPMGAGSSLLASLACSPDPCGRGGPGEEGESGPAPPLAALGRAPLRRCPWGSPSRALPQVRGLSAALCSLRRGPSGPGLAASASALGLPATPSQQPGELLPAAVCTGPGRRRGEPLLLPFQCAVVCGGPRGRGFA